MPRQSNGTFQQPANTAAISGAAIASAAYNTLIADIGNEITNSLDRQGRSAMSAALPMGNNKITGMADPSTSTDGATKNYVDTATAAFFSTGDVKFTYKSVPDTGWLMCNDVTIGNAGSGAVYSNVDALPLFTLLWNNVSNANAPVSGGRGVSASADWTGLKTMQLPLMLGRVLGVAGNGIGVIGQALGSATGTLSQTNLPNVNFTVTEPNGGLGHQHLVVQAGTIQAAYVGTSFAQFSPGAGTNVPTIPANMVNNNIYLTGLQTTGITVGSGGSGTAFSLMQPSAFMNAMIKK